MSGFKKVKLGESKDNIMKDHNISNTVFNRLRDNGEKIDEIIKNNLEALQRKNTKGSSDKRLNTAWITWFQQIRDRGDPISGPKLKEKALLLIKKLNPASNFKVSIFWAYK